MLRDNSVRNHIDQSVNYKYKPRVRVVSQKNPIYQSMFERIITNGPENGFEQSLSYLIKKLFKIGQHVIKDE